MQGYKDIQIDSEHSNLLGRKNASNIKNRESTYIQREEVKKMKKILCIVFVCMMTVLCIGWVRSAFSVKTRDISTNSSTKITMTKQRLPNILWIYTQNEREAEPMENDIFVNYYEEVGRKAEYEVRFANSWNSYDWISNTTSQKITKTMQNNLIDQNVHSLLKMALLIENGGVLLDWGNLFLTDNFGYFEEMFDVSQGKTAIQSRCDKESAYLYMAESDDPVFGNKFSSSVIAAVPSSHLLRSAFDVLTGIMTSGVIPFSEELNLLRWNEDIGVHFLERSLQTAINIAIFKKNREEKGKSIDSCKFGIQSPLVKIDIPMEKESFFWHKTITQSKNGVQNLEQFLQLKGMKINSSFKYISGINKSATKILLQALIMERIKPQQVSQKSLIYKILSIPRNRQVFLEKLPEKKVELCLVFMESLSKQDTKKTALSFDNQTFLNWKIIIPSLESLDSPQNISEKVLLIKGYPNKVQNIEKSVAKYCPKRGYAILLNKGENFNSITDLEDIAKAVQPYNIGGLFISLKKDGRITFPKKKWTYFNRHFSAILRTHTESINRFLNHFRIFSVQAFRQIPKFQMCNMYGKYYQDRSIFLMDLMDMAYWRVTDPSHHFLRKKFNYIWQLPLNIEMAPINTSIIIQKWEEVDQEQLKATSSRITGISLQQQLASIIHYKVPFSKLVAFNSGEDFVSADERKGPELIPRKIHQVWLGSKMPPAKKYFYQKTKRMYSNYEVKLWKEENITRQNFPNTYDLIQTFLKFNKHSPYGKLASVTDFMRHQILYYEGGIWKDAAMNFLRPIFDKFLKYKLVLPVDRVGRYRYLQGMCFFGNMPRYQNMLRINNFRNLNRMRIYDPDAANIAGPVDFRQLLVRQEQYDPNILILAYETIYPAPIGQHPIEDLCIKRKKQMRYDQLYDVKENGWYILSNCPKIYPYAFAIEHNRLGNSWQRRRG